VTRPRARWRQRARLSLVAVLMCCSPALAGDTADGGLSSEAWAAVTGGIVSSVLALLFALDRLGLLPKRSASKPAAAHHPPRVAAAAAPASAPDAVAEALRLFRAEADHNKLYKSFAEGKAAHDRIHSSVADIGADISDMRRELSDLAQVQRHASTEGRVLNELLRDLLTELRRGA